MVMTNAAISDPVVWRTSGVRRSLALGKEEIVFPLYTGESWEGGRKHSPGFLGRVRGFPGPCEMTRIKERKFHNPMAWPTIPHHYGFHSSLFGDRCVCLEGGT